jgi:hypothetical protein
MAYEKDVFAFIQAQESAYKRPIHLTDSWDWSMAEHIRLSVLYKNSQLSSGNPGGLKPIKNITRPILNLQYRAEGFDVKDITIFVDDSKEYYKSLLIRKFHEKWALENAMDTFIDSLVELPLYSPIHSPTHCTYNCVHTDNACNSYISATVRAPIRPRPKHIHCG